MLAEVNFKPLLDKDWGKSYRNPYYMPDFLTAAKMTDDELYIFATNNGLYTGDVNLDIFRKVAGKFLESDVLSLCHLISSQRYKIRPSVVVLGSAAYKTYATQKDTLGWYYEMSGLNRRGPEENEVLDFDLWIPNKTMLYLTEKGWDFQTTRSNSKIVIAKVREGDLKFQIHSLRESDLNPLIASSFMSSTDLVATSIVFDGPDVYFSDPFDAISKGPWEQEFPYRIFDENNFLLTNEPRRAISIMFWAINTPFFPRNGIYNQDKIKNEVSQMIKKMDPILVQAIVEKYNTASIRKPYSEDLFELSTAFTVARLTKLGIFPALLDRVKELKLDGLKNDLLNSIGLFVAEMNEINNKVCSQLPQITVDELDQAIIGKDFLTIEKKVNQIDWDIISNMELPRPY